MEGGEEVQGRLIGGPGNCYALTDNNQPQLVVFGDDAEFVTAGERPSVTVDGLGTMEVGAQTSFTAVEMNIDNVDGIPDRCSQGAANTVLVLSS